MNEYTVFFFSEWQIPDPGYYWVDNIRGNTPHEAFENNLPQLIQAVRKSCDLDDTIDDDYIAEMLYVVRSDQWLSFREVYRQASFA